MQKTLTILPDTERVESWLTTQAALTDFVDGRDVLSLAELVDRCRAMSDLPSAVATTLQVRSIVAAVCHQQEFGQLQKSATPEFARSVHSTLSHLRMQLQSPNELDAIGRACERDLTQTIHWLAVVWRRTDAVLSKQHLVDPADQLWGARDELLRVGVPPWLRRYSKIVVRHVHDFFPARLQFFRALAVACQRAQIGLEIHWPATFVDQTDLFVTDAIRQMEAEWQSLSVELLADELVDRCAADPGEKSVSIASFSAPNQKKEIQEIARRIWRLIQAGAAADSIAVVARNVDASSELYRAAFDALGIPLRYRVSAPLWATTPGRMALALYDLSERDFPADQVAEFLMLQGGEDLSDVSARALAIFQAAAIRNNRIGASAERGAYAERLAQLQARTRSRGRIRDAAIDSIDELTQATIHLIDVCQSLPSDATVAAHCAAWRRALANLKFHVPKKPRASGDLNPSVARSIEYRLAEFQAATEALSQFVEVLSSSIALSGLESVTISKLQWSRWLYSFGVDVRVQVGTPVSGAVRLIEFSQIAGHRFDHLFIAQLVDGSIPRSAPAPFLVSDDDAVRVNRAARRRIFRTRVRDNEMSESLHVAEDRLLFAMALASAEQSITLSGARLDVTNREQSPSPFWEALKTQKKIRDHSIVGYRHIPHFTEAATENDFRLRTALLHCSPPSTRIDAGDKFKVASRWLVDEPWFQEVRTLTDIENERFRFFLNASHPSSPWTGRLTGQAKSILQRRLDFSSERSISAAELQTWATCPFKGFASFVLGIRPMDEASEEVTAATRGTYWHELLRQVVSVLEATGRLGSPSMSEAEIRRAIDDAVGQVAPQLASRVSLGHPAVWEIVASRSTDLLVQFLLNREAVLPLEAARPTHHELRFGGAHSPEENRLIEIAPDGPDETLVRLNGKIDRIDLADGLVAVIDYKTTVKEPGVLKSELFVTDFQMPIYLLVAHVLFPDRKPNAFWLGLVDQKTRSLDAVFQNESSILRSIDVSPAGRTEALRNSEPNLANAVHQLLGRLRTGDLGPRSRSCDYCDFASVCRIAGRSPVLNGAML